MKKIINWFIVTLKKKRERKKRCKSYPDWKRKKKKQKTTLELDCLPSNSDIVSY